MGQFCLFFNSWATVPLPLFHWRNAVAGLYKEPLLLYIPFEQSLPLPTIPVWSPAFNHQESTDNTPLTAHNANIQGRKATLWWLSPSPFGFCLRYPSQPQLKKCLFPPPPFPLHPSESWVSQDIVIRLHWICWDYQSFPVGILHFLFFKSSREKDKASLCLHHLVGQSKGEIPIFP